MTLNFVDELLQKLTEYGDIDREIETLKLQKNKIRKQVYAWMNMHQLDEYITTDLKDRVWKLSKQTKKMTKPNWTYIEEHLDDSADRSQIKIITESDPFVTIRRLKSRD